MTLWFLKRNWKREICIFAKISLCCISLGILLKKGKKSVKKFKSYKMKDLNLSFAYKSVT